MSVHKASVATIRFCSFGTCLVSLSKFSTLRIESSNPIMRCELLLSARIAKIVVAEYLMIFISLPPLPPLLDSPLARSTKVGKHSSA